MGCERRVADRSDEQPHHRAAAAARRSAGTSDHRGCGPALEVDSQLEGVPAAAWLCLRPGRRWPVGRAWRLRDLLRSDLPEPDDLLALTERSGDLLADSEPDELRRWRRAGGELPIWRGSAAAPTGVQLCAASPRILRPHQRSGYDRPARPQAVDRLPEDIPWQLDGLERLRAQPRVQRGTRAGHQPADPLGLRPGVPRLHARRSAVRGRSLDPLLRRRISGRRAWCGPPGPGQHDWHDQRVEVRFLDHDGQGPRPRCAGLAELRARQLAGVGWTADRVLQR